MSHGHDDGQPCGMNCPVGPVRIHFDAQECSHAFGDVCQSCAALSDAEVDALREYFRLLKAAKAAVPGAIGVTGEAEK